MEEIKLKQEKIEKTLVSFQIETELYNAVKKAAKKQRVSIRALTEYALKLALKELNK